MCIDVIFTDEITKEWLENKPDTITAYKVVKIEDKKAYPPVFWGQYKKTNKLDSEKCPGEKCPGFTMVLNKRGSYDYVGYKAYYHIFSTKQAAKEWSTARWSFLKTRATRVLECEIPKKSITAVGTELGCTVIITKEFTFTEGNEYFEEEE